jgi:hypothetical protein
VVIIKLWILAITYLTKIVQQFESKKGVNLVGETVGCKFDEGEIIVIRGKEMFVIHSTIATTD